MSAKTCLVVNQNLLEAEETRISYFKWWKNSVHRNLIMPVVEVTSITIISTHLNKLSHCSKWNPIIAVAKQAISHEYLSLGYLLERIRQGKQTGNNSVIWLLERVNTRVCAGIFFFLLCSEILPVLIPTVPSLSNSTVAMFAPVFCCHGFLESSVVKKDT